MSYSNSHDSHHILIESHMLVIVVGLRYRCGEQDTAFLLSLMHNAAQGVFVRSSVDQAVRGEWLVPRLIWGIYVKRTFISAAAILAFAASAHADDLSDIQAQTNRPPSVSPILKRSRRRSRPRRPPFRRSIRSTRWLPTCPTRQRSRP